MPKLSFQRGTLPLKSYLNCFFDDIFCMPLLKSRGILYYKTHQISKGTKEELKRSFGVSYGSKFKKSLGKRFYRDSGSDMRNKMVCAAIMRDRFTHIMRFHVADDKIIPTCRMRNLRLFKDKQL